MSRDADPIAPVFSVVEPENGADVTAPQVAGLAPPEWTRLIPSHEWEVYLAAIEALRNSGVRFMLGGAFGLAAYTDRWRNTKDVDFFLLPRDRQRATNALLGAGFSDYFDVLPYDRGWIFRATRGGVIVDLIWGTPNRRTEVDEEWLERSTRIALRTEILEVVPAEELTWIKLYVLQRDRSDWPDIINLLYATSAWLDWDRIVERLDDDLPLFTGVLSVFAWVCPDKIKHIPALLRKGAGIRRLGRSTKGPDLRCINLLDSRPWFAALQPPDQPMRI